MLEIYETKNNKIQVITIKKKIRKEEINTIKNNVRRN
jgi:hypothetical protein